MVSSIEKISYGFLSAILAVCLWYAYTDIDIFNTVLAAEDGVLESLTALFLFGTAGVALSRLLRAPNRKFAFRAMCVFVAIVFVFGGAEEISWGQRIFDIESSAFFTANNAQGETNLHNMVVGGTKVNLLLFGPLLSFVVLFYLVIFPMLHRRYASVRRIEEIAHIPVPRPHHAAVFMISLVVVLAMPSDRKWEILEFCIALFALLVYLHPLNVSATGHGVTGDAVEGREK